jgi:Tol biopolymer transport system component
VIAFISQRDGNFEIYVINADGSDPRRLTNDAGEDDQPAWSPDGSQFAFDSDRGGNFEIYVMATDGTGLQRLTTNRAVDAGPDWSPDGTRITFVSLRDGNAEIYVMNADGSDQRRLTQNPPGDFEPDWSPDSTQIAFSSQRTGEYADIYTMDADGGNLRQLTDSDGHDAFPDWSPDGSQFVFISERDGNWEIYTMNADGSNQARLTENEAVDGEPKWSPDGTQIAFVSNRDGDEEIYVMDADGSNVRRLTDNEVRDRKPNWRPNPTTAVSAKPPTQAALGETWARPIDGMVMVYVPPGEFQMGSDDDEVDLALDWCNTYYQPPCARAWFEVESPPHTVALDDFWIDRTEVSNAQYRQCVEAGICVPPVRNDSASRDAYYGDSAFDAYPVIYVSWQQALDYCTWVGGHLPSEAQWEYAARGPEGWRFPWGNDYDGARLNSCDVNCPYGWAAVGFDDGYEDTAPVGSFPEGASWCGALDLAGNVWEWVADRFGPYAGEYQENPTGPAEGSERTLRGDAADGTRPVSRSAARHGMHPSRTYLYTGFRCVIAADD